MSGPVTYATAVKESSESKDRVESQEVEKVQTSQPVNSSSEEKTTDESISTTAATASSGAGETKNKEKKDKKDKKEKEKRNSAVYVPAPVPTVNAWAVRKEVSGASTKGDGLSPVLSSDSVASPESNGSYKPSSAVVDDSNWPKPDLVANTQDIATNGKPANKQAIKSGKEKWVPFTPVFVSTGPNKSGVKSRYNNNHHHHHNHNTHSNNHNSTSNNTTNQFNSHSNSSSRGSSSPTSPDAGNGNGKRIGGNRGFRGGPGKKYYKEDFRRYNNGTTTTTANGNMSNNTSNSNSTANSPIMNLNGGGNKMFGYGSREMTLGLIAAQVDYYLSIENMCKDLFLRKHMNSQGLIGLKVLAKFNRIKSLTAGDYNLLQEASKLSQVGQVIGEKIRPRIGWENWVLPLQDRFEEGKDEENDSDSEDRAPKFNAAQAVPFTPKVEPKIDA